MFKMLLLLIISVLVVYVNTTDPASDQLLIYKNETQGPIGILTTGAGVPVERKDARSTLNKNLLDDEYFLESLAHVVRENIPLRIVHQKGAGAFGYFKTTHDISDKCKAAFLSEIGKKTPIAARFSAAFTKNGGSDIMREPRGFAVKIYTEEGNFDIVGFNTPIFIFKDPVLFAPFTHALGNNPATGFFDENAFWDFLTLRPETIFIFLIVFSDQGIPDGYIHMPGYSIHTYPIYNAAGKISYARFHFRPLSGIKNLNSTEAANIEAVNPSYSAKQLYNAIACGDYPTWLVSLQFVTEEDLKNITLDPFDVSKLLPESQFPLWPVGEMVLNRNPVNYFAEVEQMAFCPSNLVPGISRSPGKLFGARILSYKDAQRYRLGSNFNNIPVNCPYRSKVFNYIRDGTPPVNGNGYDAPSYYPNSFNGPVPYIDENKPIIPNIYEAEANNFEQAREYYTNQFTREERIRLVQNIVASLCKAANFLQDKAVKIFSEIHYDLANRVAKELKKNNCKR